MYGLGWAGRADNNSYYLLGPTSRSLLLGQRAVQPWSYCGGGGGDGDGDEWPTNPPNGWLVGWLGSGHRTLGRACAAQPPRPLLHLRFTRPFHSANTHPVHPPSPIGSRPPRLAVDSLIVSSQAPPRPVLVLLVHRPDSPPCTHAAACPLSLSPSYIEPAFRC